MLIIFDCDGVLVDSEFLAAEVFSDVLDKIGFTMSVQECFDAFHGKTLQTCYDWLENNKRLILPDNFHILLEKQTKEHFLRELRPVDGIRRVLDYLVEGNIDFCVASNGGHKKIKHSLRVTGLLPYFKKRFSAEDVGCGKPAPELFLHAADHYGCASSETIVVEDSFTGYEAAKAAGMEVFVYRADIREVNHNFYRFDHMRDLIGLLKTKIDTH